METPYGRPAPSPEIGKEEAGGESFPRVVRRKAFHIATIGAMALLAALAPRVVALRVLGAALALVFVALVVIDLRPRRERKELEAKVRRKDKAFAMQGTVFSLLGALSALLLFPPTLAAAALGILALGDSVSTLYAMKLGRVDFPWADKKADGWLVGVLAGAAVAALLVPWWAALVASVVSQVPDLVDPEDAPIWFDDNLLTPLFAGATLFILLAF